MKERTPPSKRLDPNEVGLPLRPFLFTLDQIAGLLSIELTSLRDKHVYFDGRSVGARPLDQLMARNIALEGDTPDWRVADQEVVRWMRRKGFRIYERGWVRF